MTFGGVATFSDECLMDAVECSEYVSVSHNGRGILIHREKGKSSTRRGDSAWRPLSNG